MPSHRSHRISSQRGSALVVGLVLTLAVGIVVAFTLRTSVVESRLNEAHFLSLNARNAAESIVDYGVGQLIRRWDNQVSFRDDELSPNKTPLTIENEIKSFLTAGHIDPASLTLVGGLIPPNEQFYINPDDPANRFDPHKGKIVLARDIHVYGQAKATHPILGDYTARAVQTLQLRDAPLFSHAIFYNMDLEFHPGPTMTINGPVHANGNIWAVAKNNLYFSSNVTTSQDFRVSMMSAPYQGDWSSMPGESSQSGRYVKIKNGSNAWTDPYRGAGATNKEASFYSSVTSDFAGSGYKDWRELAANRWAGNLQTRAHGIPVLNPVGYADYVPDYDGSTTVENHAYAIIEPNLPLASPYHKRAGEREKFARKAGLIIRVHRDLDDDGVDDDRATAIPAHAVRLRARPDAEDSWSTDSRVWLEYNKQFVIDYNAWEADVAAGGTDPAPTYAPPAHPSVRKTNYHLSFASLQRSDTTEPNSDPVVNTSTITVPDDQGNPISLEVSEIIEDAIFMTGSFDADQDSSNDPADPAEVKAYAIDNSGFGDQLRAEFDEMFAAHPVVYEADDNTDYNGDGDKSDLLSGMIDKRIEKAGGSTNQAKSRINLIEMNLAAFKRQVETWNGDTFQNYYMPYRYNGVVYVEMPPDTTHTPRSSDKILKAVENTAVFLTQGGGYDPWWNTTASHIPDPAYNINQANRDRGFTLATNGPLYVRGHFNADGNMGTPSAGSFTESDLATDPDPPVALAADAVSVLSPNWSIANSRNTNPDAQPCEFSAAIVCGLMPTNKGGASVSSGGSHNFPRFLEKWSGKTFRYRGSLVALFESEIQNQKWGGAYYSPPARQWGFFGEFARGNYPPGTPNVRSYRKIDFRYLSAAEFEDSLDALPWTVTLP